MWTFMVCPRTTNGRRENSAITNTNLAAAIVSRWRVAMTRATQMGGALGKVAEDSVAHRMLCPLITRARTPVGQEAVDMQRQKGSFGGAAG